MPFDARAVPVARSTGLQPKTVRNIHVMLHTALANAVNWRYVMENVAEHVKPPKVRRRKPTVRTAGQLRTFLTSVREDRFYPLYLLAAIIGLRRGELCGLRWPALDCANGEPDNNRNGPSSTGTIRRPTRSSYGRTGARYTRT
ncbi:hypothetical protein Raf01_09080 [Rugosimonospora africana]|uniref:Tyr recombinase domain-containing protein n=1 Tax=Rugosimonospora africana TaxID=556532 RepID=A0A8J3QLE2_9ACTN|nr:hypothetical protein Raf01_09080 [Rugosimonospora africana]